MAIALSGTSSNNTAGATSLSIAAPTGNSSGAVLVAFVEVAGGTGATITPVDTWTLVNRTNSTTVFGQAAYVRVCGGSEPANYVFNFDSSRSGAGGVMAFSGVDNATPQDVAGAGQANASSFTNTCPSLTTVSANAWIINGWGANLSNSFSAYTAGLTEQYTQDSTANAQAGTTSTQAVAGASGTKTCSNFNKAVCIGHSIALRPGAAVVHFDQFLKKPKVNTLLRM
jgi:hypothetical protein